MKLNYIFCVSILASACIFVVESVVYTDLEALGIACPNLLSCTATDQSNFTRRNCECDRDCATYNDCCVDARTPWVEASSRRRVSPFPCMPFGKEPNLGAYAISTCSRYYTGSAEVHRKCQNLNDISDPLMSVPVTDVVNRRTYRSSYCAECNNVALENLKTWLIRMDCNITGVNDTYILNLRYRQDLNKWGVIHNNKFQSCRIMFDIPEYLRNSVRFCRANIISRCRRNSARLSVRTACESYTAVMYTNGEDVYKNPHCAICNGLTVDDMQCATGIFSRKGMFSFALLLDFNINYGNVVGLDKPTCKPDQKYDPFFNKCRDVFCVLPGYIKVVGKCVRS